MTDSTNIVKFPDRSKVREEAASWVAICESRPLSAERLDELRLWLSQSSAHEEEFERLAALWGQLDILDELNYLDDIRRPSNVKKVSKVIAGIVSAVAAIWVVGVGFNLVDGTSSSVFPKVNSSMQHEQFSTLVGEKRDVTLADGSIVTLNTGSKMSVEFTDSGRDVFLLAGEAHFEVTKDVRRTFSVHTSDGVVRAVGTAFSVKLDTSSVEVTVTEGRVKVVEPFEIGDTHISKSVGGGQELAAGDYARVVRAKVELLQPLSNSELNRRMSWRRGLLAFAGEPLSEVILEVGRYTDVDIIVDDPAIAELPIGGYFKAGDVDGLLEAIGQTFDLKIEYQDENTVHIRRAV
ncbi:FecR family protein [Hirschia litorea]|uniref:FecR family protein n=1 Tax=Hirschia litorea TaxID=1199156 RepID=A0ABW2INL9_9PROT